MWDLETIIRINNEAWEAFKKKNSTTQSKQEEAERNAGIWNPKKGVFGEVTYVRSMYEGEVDRHPPQSGTGETLP